MGSVHPGLADADDQPSPDVSPIRAMVFSDRGAIFQPIDNPSPFSVNRFSWPGVPKLFFHCIPGISKGIVHEIAVFPKSVIGIQQHSHIGGCYLHSAAATVPGLLYDFVKQEPGYPPPPVFFLNEHA